MTAAPIDEFGPFKLIRQLGDPGGFGTAYEAIRDGSRCVVKVFHGELVDPVALGRFEREVKAQRRISHPNLIDYLDSGVASGVATWQGRRCHWISMPFLAGRTLHEELIAGGGRMAPEQARAIATQVATGLSILHEEGIVHRDLKPSNIFICDDDQVVILDFGIALFLDYTSLTERGGFVGTWGYAAPEQLNGEEVPATDLYALGVILYRAITGQMPFSGRVLLELIYRIQFEDPEPPSSFSSDVPAELEQLVLWLLEKEAHRRPPSAEQVAGLLSGALASVVAHKPRAYSGSARPLLFLRAARERDTIVRACVRACSPAAIIAALTDKGARKTARKVAGFHNARFAADPQTFRYSHPNFSMSRALSESDLAPSDGISPYEPEDFHQISDARAFAAKVVDEQIDAGANLLYGASFPIRGLHDPWLARTAKLLEESVRRRDQTAADLPLYAPLILSLHAFCTAETQSRLANKLSRANVDGYVLMCDQLTPEAAPALLANLIRISLVLQQSGRPVVLARAGSLRHFVLPFGVAGAELGIGRYHGFRLSDYESRRPFGIAAPRFEIPSLLASFPPEQAARILESKLVPESTCPCPSCRSTSSVEAQIERTIEHDAAMYELMCDELAEVPPRERVDRLDRAVARALELERALLAAKVIKAHLEHLRLWPHAIVAARPFLDDAALRLRAA